MPGERRGPPGSERGRVLLPRPRIRGGGGRREGGVPPPLQLRKSWSQAGSGQDRPLLANFCPTPTRAHHPCLRRSPWDLLGNQLPAEEGGWGEEREWSWAASQKSECVCKLVFSQKLSGTCVFGEEGGEGGSVEKEQDPFFLPGPGLPRRAVSLKRQRALTFLFLFHPPASLDKPLWGRGSFKGDCDL